MGCGCNSINNTCGEHHYAACTRYEGALPAFTTLSVQNCYTLEEIIADIYLIETAIKDELDLTDLLTNGIEYTLVEGVLITKNALKKHAEVIIALQEDVDGLKGGTDELFGITDWNLVLGCVADSCGNPPSMLKDLVQLMIDKMCNIENKNGVLDYNDLFTQTSPISVTGGGGFEYLTNDGLGTFTNKNFPPFGVTDIWDASLNFFDFHELNLGAVVHIRLDLLVTTNTGNQEVEVEIEAGIGGNTYSLGVSRTSYKSAGTYQLNATTLIYIGDDNTRLNPAKLKIKSDGNADVIVNGWACGINNY